MTFLSSVDALSRTLVDATAKATVLLVVAWLVNTVLSRSSAAIRHRTWSLTMMGLLLLPVLSWGLPAWQLPILPANGTAHVAQSGPIRQESLASVSRPGKVLSSDETLATMPTVNQGVATAPGSVASFGSFALPSEPRGWLSLLAVGGWCLGTLVCLSGIVGGLWHARQLSLGSQVVGDEPWRQLMKTLQERLGLRRKVELREYAQPIVPLTWGLFRPTVMLPQQARTWANTMRRAVLLHELVHIQRGDVAYQLLGRVACSLYWFHPLAWFGLKQLRQEREQACDDAVVHTGEQASNYAEQLVEVARLYHRPGGLSLAVEMARGGSLEQRLLSLFDSTRSHRPLSHRRSVAMLLLTGVLLCTVAIVRPVSINSVVAAEEPKQPPAVATVAEPAKTAPRTTKRTSMPENPIRVGVVIAKHVMLWEGKEIVTWKQIEEKMAAYPDPSLLYPQFSFTPSALPYDGERGEKGRNAQTEAGRLSSQFKYYGYGIGSIAQRSGPRYDRIQSADDLKVNEANRIEGRVLDPAGKPVANAEVLLVTRTEESVAYKTYEMNLRQGQVSTPLDHIMTRTDENGGFRLYPAAGENFGLIALHSDAGFAFVRKEQFIEKRELTMMAWASLECELNSSDVSPQFISLTTRVPEFGGLPDIAFSLDSDSWDKKRADRKFKYSHVPPFFSTQIQRGFPDKEGVSFHLPAATVELLPGETRQLSFGPLSQQQRDNLESNRRAMFERSKK